MFELISEITGVEAVMFRRAIIIEIAIWVVMLVAVLIDMRTGIRRARTLGIAPDSHGMRRTFTKLGDYGKVTVMLLLIDILAILFGIYILPWASGASAVGAVLIECWSVRENLRAVRSSAAIIPDFARKLAGTKDPQEVTRIMQDFMTLWAQHKENETRHQSVDGGEAGADGGTNGPRRAEPGP